MLYNLSVHLLLIQCFSVFLSLLIFNSTFFHLNVNEIWKKYKFLIDQFNTCHKINIVISQISLTI